MSAKSGQLQPAGQQPDGRRRDPSRRASSLHLPALRPCHEHPADLHARQVHSCATGWCMHAITLHVLCLHHLLIVPLWLRQGRSRLARVWPHAQRRIRAGYVCAVIVSAASLPCATMSRSRCTPLLPPPPTAALRHYRHKAAATSDHGGAASDFLPRGLSNTRPQICATRCTAATRGRVSNKPTHSATRHPSDGPGCFRVLAALCTAPAPEHRG